MIVRDCKECGGKADYRVEIIGGTAAENYYLKDSSYFCKSHLVEACKDNDFEKNPLNFIVALEDGGCYLNPNSARNGEAKIHSIRISELEFHLMLNEDKSVLF